MGDNIVSILVVDDRKENILALESLLEEPEVEIVSALSGNEALAKMVKQEFALVLMDVQMPEMNGFETAELMRGSAKTKHIPIIFLTAINKDQKYVFKGYQSGGVDYLFKPIVPEILQSKVKIFCDLHRQKKLIQQQIDVIAAKNEALEKYLAEIKVLKGLIPICANCKKIRNDDGYWEAVEIYLQDRSDAEFTHSICPPCKHELYPELLTDEDFD